jgi:hypothetical protein
VVATGVELHYLATLALDTRPYAGLDHLQGISRTANHIGPTAAPCTRIVDPHPGLADHSTLTVALALDAAGGARTVEVRAEHPTARRKREHHDEEDQRPLMHDREEA